jgi:hypothetical protein
MIGSDHRPSHEAPLDEVHGEVRRTTLPPPELASPLAGSAGRSPGAAKPLDRQSGIRAEEAWLRARVEEARAAGDTTALRTASTALARWLASRDRDLDEAVDLATTALSLGADIELRRELSAWLEGLGEAVRAANALKPIAASVDMESVETAHVLVRTGLLKARAGAASGAATAFEAATAIDPEDALPGELLGALSGWQSDAVSAALAAEAYVEAARRRAARWHEQAEYEDLWRAVAADPSSETAVDALARGLERRGRAGASDEIWRAHAGALATVDGKRAAAVHSRRRAAAQARGDTAGAVAASLDQAMHRRLEDAQISEFGGLLVDLGIPEPAALHLRASLESDLREQTVQLERAAALLVSPPLQALLLSLAADRYVALSDSSAARSLAERAIAADSTCLRAAATLADTLATERDRGAARAIARAIALVGPRVHWCSSLAEILDALGDLEFAIAWSKRCVALRPGDCEAVEKLVDRLLRAGDAPRLGDALAWIQSQPLPLAAIGSPFAHALRELARLDVDRAVVVARRALDVFGPRLPAMRDAMLDVAGRACDYAFTAAIFERWLSCGAEGADRRQLFVALAELYERLDDKDGEARIVCRALREGVALASIDSHFGGLAGGRPATPDALLWGLQARANRLSADDDSEAASQVWREVGAALWDLADDRVGAIAAWLRAARTARFGGWATLTADLVSFGGGPFALEYLGRTIDSEPDDLTAAAIAVEVARAALDLGEPRSGLDLAARGVARCPAAAQALEVAEACADRADEHRTLSALYELVAERALGRFGRRSAHYRGARFFEHHGQWALALQHAALAFRALPSEGSTFHLLARAAERAGDRAEAARTVESVAASVGRSEIRAAWLVLAARVAGEDPDSAKYRVDALLGAALASPTVATIALLRDAARALIQSDPDEREGLEIRLGRAARTIGKTLKGPEGSRVAIAIASLAVEVLDDAETGLASLERAFACDADVPEFAVLLARGQTLARAKDARQRVASLLSATDSPLGGGGVAALRVLSNVASALGDGPLQARAQVAAALRDPSDDELVVAADAATRSVPELSARLAGGLSRERRAEALHALARAHAATGAHADAARLLERVVDLTDGDARIEIEAELRAVRSAARGATEGADARRTSLTDAVSSLRTRAERWTEIAARREARADVVGAVRALLEACKLDPEALGRWSALERVAEIAGDDEARVLALEQIAKRVGVDGRAAVFKRLARAHGSRNDLQAAEKVWREVLALDPADEEADQAIESVIVSGSRYAELAEHLAVRAGHLNKDPSRSESLRAVRLRRAAILDQRLERLNDACEELERLLTEAPDNSGALRYLADLLERLEQHARAAPLWARAAAAEPRVDERDELEVRAGRASAMAGNFAVSLEHARRVLAHDPNHRVALELRRRAAEALGADAELGETLEQLAGETDQGAVSQSELLVEAALVAARAGDLDLALVRARRAARAAPEQATPQLLARGLEYRLRGAGAPDEARATVDELARIGQPLGADDVALRSFLVAEALDVVRGGGAGMRELETAQALVGGHPLIALGLAERLAAQGHSVAAVDAYRATLAGPLLGLRTPGKVALSAADTAIKAGRLQDASYFLDLAERDEDARGAATSRRAQLNLGHTPPEGRPIVTAGSDRSTETLQAAIHNATDLHARALARFALGQARLEQGDERGAKRLLLDALADGLADAGDALVPLLASSPDHGRDLVQIRYQQAAIAAGDIGRLESLRTAALADGDMVYASAAEHVLRAFDPAAGPLLPPPLAVQSERSGILALLARQSMDGAGEALALLWDGAAQLFARDAASYSVTGVERVVPGPTSAIARLYDVAVRVLDTPRIPLFVPRAGSGAPTWRVALLQPPSVILTGDVREENSEIRFELGRGLSAALPHNVLRLGLPGAEGRLVIEALHAAFGPAEIGRRVDPPTARMAESLWQILSPPTQRRTQQLMASSSFPDYAELVARAHQSGLRVGMFLAGDFGIAARTVLAESGTRVDAPSIDTLRDLCQSVPALADLLRLAINPQYANARWRDEEDATVPRTPSGRFSPF